MHVCSLLVCTMFAHWPYQPSSNVWHYLPHMPHKHQMFNVVCVMVCTYLATCCTSACTTGAYGTYNTTSTVTHACTCRCSTYSSLHYNHLRLYLLCRPQRHSVALHQCCHTVGCNRVPDITACPCTQLMLWCTSVARVRVVANDSPMTVHECLCFLAYKRSMLCPCSYSECHQRTSAARCLSPLGACCVQLHSLQVVGVIMHAKAC